MGKGTFERDNVGIFPDAAERRSPVALVSGFPHALSTSGPIGRLQKQSSVTLNFPNEKFPAMRPLVKIL